MAHPADSFISPKDRACTSTAIDPEAHEMNEISLPTLPATSGAVSMARNESKSGEELRKERQAEQFAMAACVLSMFMEGWNDSSAGPVCLLCINLGYIILITLFCPKNLQMLPAMQKHYGVSSE